MSRIAALLIALLSIPAPSIAQTPSATTTPAAQVAPQPKPAAKKAATRPKAPARPLEQTTTGPCGIGIIAAAQDPFVVEKIGLTIFGNEYAEVQVSWGLDDLVFARTRAAAGATPLRRIVYTKGAFDSYYHPKPSLFRNERDELTKLTRQIAGNAGCERYVVITRDEGVLSGTNIPLRGIGILNRGIGPISHSFIYAYIRVTVFDGQTFEIRKGPAVTLDGVLKHMSNGFGLDEHLRKVDNSMFPVATADADSNAALRDNVRDVLTQRLDKILPPHFAP